MLDHEKLTYLRKACGYTRTQMLKKLAEDQHIFISHQQLAQYESGKVRNPAPLILLSLASFYCVSPSELLKPEV